MNGDTLFLIGIAAALATVAAVAREHLRPSAPGDGGQGFGNDDPHQAAVLNDLSHIGTDTRRGR